MCNHKLHVETKEHPMADIRHRVEINAAPSEVYAALATPEGVATWWTQDAKGDASEGGEIEFWFGGERPAAVMQLVELRPPRRVVWQCEQGPEEWVGTTQTFDVREHDGKSVVMFTHADWSEPVEFMHHCSTRWGYFLLSLKHQVEQGAGTPWPNDEKF
jgi:uncharacterized protein YndB with AHSA1/START domain